MITKTQPIIQLRFDDRDTQVRVETEKDDRFFTKQFRKLQAALTRWYQEHERTIAKAYLTLRDSGILFLVVQQSATFNQELEESLTDLDLSVAQDDEFNLIRLNVLALPAASEDSIQSFLVCGSSIF